MSSGETRAVPLAPAPMVPYVCMTCGESRSLPGGYASPYCPNHGTAVIWMQPFPIDLLRQAVIPS